MKPHRYLFLPSPIEPGNTYKLGSRDLHYIRDEPYERADGSQSTLLVWCTACLNCGKSVEYKTGRTAGDIPSRCKECQLERWKDRDEASKRATQLEYTVDTPATAVEVYRAVQAVQSGEKKQMSVAPNAPRRIFAPLMLREAHAPLAEHTFGEILEGIDEALNHRIIGWEVVGRYKSGNGVKGLVARNEAALRKQGFWPKDEANASADFFA